MLQTPKYALRQIGYVFVLFVNFIADLGGDNFVVCLACVEQTEAADWFCL
jgi:hypothetical protein